MNIYNGRVLWRRPAVRAAPSANSGGETADNVALGPTHRFAHSPPIQRSADGA